MPIQPLRVDCNDLDEQITVHPGSVVNGVTILNVPTGVELFFRLGNNPRIGPITDPITLYFGDDLDISDVSEGLWFQVDVLTPGSFVRGWISYRSSLPKLDDGSAISGVR
jgi:hypothetical protein